MRFACAITKYVLILGIIITGYRNKRSANDIKLRVKRYSFQGERWSRKKLTWNLRHIEKRPSYGNHEQVDSLDRGSVRRVLTHALDMWARRTELVFTEAHPDDETADLQGINVNMKELFSKLCAF